MKKEKKKISFNLLEEYKNCWNYLRTSRRFIWIIIGLFSLFVLLGFFISPPDFLYNQIIEFIKELLETTKDMSGIDLVRFIILNNLQSTLFGILLGLFLGIFPIFSAVINGYMLGFVSSISVSQDGVLSLWKLFPHGIFELPAVFISLGLGLKFGTFIFQKKKMKSLKEYATNSLKIFLLIIVPLLVIAGIIEGILIAVGG